MQRYSRISPMTHVLKEASSADNVRFTALDREVYVLTTSEKRRICNGYYIIHGYGGIRTCG